MTQEEKWRRFMTVATGLVFKKNKDKYTLSKKDAVLGEIDKSDVISLTSDGAELMGSISKNLGRLGVGEQPFEKGFEPSVLDVAEWIFDGMKKLRDIRIKAKGCRPIISIENGKIAFTSAKETPSGWVDFPLWKADE